MSSFKAAEWRRLYEAERKDRRGRMPQDWRGWSETRFATDLQESLESGAYRPVDFSFRELFEHMVDGGREILQSWSPGSGGPSAGIKLYEAGSYISTSNFMNITQTVLSQVQREVFALPTLIGTRVARVQPTNTDTEKIPTWGEIGDEAETVNEGEPYPLVGFGASYIETPPMKKRGLIVGVTKEALFGNNNGQILDRARRVNEWLAINREKRILDGVLGITNLYRRNGSAYIATYGDNSGTHSWDNLAASNALQDFSDVQNAMLLLDALVDPDTGEPITLVANQMIVPRALALTAASIVSATEFRNVTNTNTTTIGPNPLQNRSVFPSDLEILTSPYVKARTNSDSTWFYGDFFRAFMYMEMWGPLMIPAPPNSELEFTHDIVARFKGTEKGTIAADEPRRVVKNTA